MSEAAYNLDVVAQSVPAVDQTKGVPRSRPIPHVNIQAFCEDKRTADAIESASADRRLAKAKVVVHMGGIKSAIALYGDAPTPNLIIAETVLGRSEMLSDLESLAEVCDPNTKVVVVGYLNEVEIYRELLRFGVSDYVVGPVSVPQVIEAISSIYANPDTDPIGQVIAFVGAKGGSGSSTVCHNTAFALSNLVEADVVVADLDLPFGTGGLDFNLDPFQGINEALASYERLDEALLDRLLSRCADHLSLLAAPIVLDHPYNIDTNACTSVIDIMRRAVPWIAVDVPHVWTAWAKEVLLKADTVVITAAPDLANLRNTKNLLDELKRSRPNDSLPILVLNQLGVPKRPEITRKEFGSAIELEPKVAIDFDAKLFGDAANNGQMIEELSGKSDAAQSFRWLASVISDHSEPTKENESLFAPILSRLSLSTFLGRK